MLKHDQYLPISKCHLNRLNNTFDNSDEFIMTMTVQVALR